MRLNLGCGRDYRAGWINLDHAAIACDVRARLEDPLPFRDGAFAEVYASGVLEQIGPNEQFRRVMNECHRLLAPAGLLTAIVPSARFPVAFRDPFDCRRFTEETWRYLAASDRYFATYGAVYGFLPWNVRAVETNANGIMTAILERSA